MTELATLLKPEALSPTQYNVLRILRGAGKECSTGSPPQPLNHGLACTDIAARMLTHDPDITRLLDRLEQRGLVSRQRDKTDRRRITARITDAGLKLLKSLDQPVLDLHQNQLGPLGRKRLAQLMTLLNQARKRDADV